MRTQYVAIIAAVATVAGCNSSNSQCTNADGGLANVGGPVLGPIDNHCYVSADGSVPGGQIVPQFTSTPACYADAGLYEDGGPPPATIGCGLFEDGGPAGCTPVCMLPDGGPEGCAPAYGPTHYNSAANDDDCKYQTAWWSTPIVLNGNTTLYFTALRTLDGTPASGANVYAEVYLPATNHLSPSLQPPVSETPPGSGVYTIGPVVFDQPGQWTVRFHLHENCVDLLPDSPHGHSAFYVNVPQ